MCSMHISFNFSMGLKNYKIFKKGIIYELFTTVLLAQLIQEFQEHILAYGCNQCLEQQKHNFNGEYRPKVTWGEYLTQEIKIFLVKVKLITE